MVPRPSDTSAGSETPRDPGVIVSPRGRFSRLRDRRFWVRVADRLFTGATGAAALVILGIATLLVLLLVQSSYPSLTRFGFGFLYGTVWNPNQTVLSPLIFGALPAIYGTMVIAAIGMLFGVPLSLGIAIFLTELSPGWLRGGLSFVIELLAAIPSVVYGVWGLIVVVPLMATTVEPGLHATLGQLPGLSGVFAAPASGYNGFSYLTAGIILAIMVIPTISSVSREAFLVVPNDQREAALSLGATSWETTRLSVLPYARRGVLGAITLGLGRAIGETIAIVLVVGNSYAISGSLFSSGTTIAAFIATEFGEANGIERAALLELGLVLLAVSLLINVGARLLVRRGIGPVGGAE
ncbi:MAG: phosphate ABC transporter permease subunit PstC [Thermoplasmata archaeon]|nr:phosphate ABC transporter permease subunit PstC [Thermoplasmata archaeon]